MTSQLQVQQEKLLHTIFHTAWKDKVPKLERYLRGLVEARQALPSKIPVMMRRAGEHPEHQGKVDAALETLEALPAYIFKAGVMLELYRELAGMTEEDRTKFFGIIAGSHKTSLWRCFLHHYSALDLNPALFGA